MKVAVFAGLLAALVFAPAADALMIPSLTKHAAKPGERVSGSLGFGAPHVAWPTKIEVSLVRATAARNAVARTDPRLTRVATLRPNGGFMANRFSFVVPRLPSGRYTLAVWMRTNKTGRWRNAVAFAYPVAALRHRLALMIRSH